MPAMKKVFWECPKCHHTAAGDHSQCEGKCPLAMSPFWDTACAAEYGNPVPQRFMLVPDDGDAGEAAQGSGA